VREVNGLAQTVQEVTAVPWISGLSIMDTLAKRRRVSKAAAMLTQGSAQPLVSVSRLSFFAGYKTHAAGRSDSIHGMDIRVSEIHVAIGGGRNPESLD